MNSLDLRHLITIQEATCATIRGGGAPASALCDLLDNGSRAAPDSVHELLSFTQQTLGSTFDLSARLQRAAAELDGAVQRADQAQLHVLDHHALFLARRTVARVAGHLFADSEWQALMSGGGNLEAERKPPHLALLRHAGVLEAAAPRTRESLALAGQTCTAAVGYGLEETCELFETALRRRDFVHHTVAGLDLCLVLGEEVPMTLNRLQEWYSAHRPDVLEYGLRVADALRILGEAPLTRWTRVGDLLSETLRASGAVMLSMDTRTRRSAVSELAAQLVRVTCPGRESGQS